MPTNAPKPAGTAVPHTRCVLVVEDDDAVRDVVEHVLRADGWEVLLADSAAAGETAFQQHRDRIGLVLTDIVMPGRNGYWLAGRVRAACPHVPIIAMSGYNEVAEHAVSHFAHFLPKPFHPQALLDVARTAYRAPG